MSIRKLLRLCILFIIIFIAGCEHNNFFEDITKLPFNMFDNQEDTVNNLVNKEGLTRI